MQNPLKPTTKIYKIVFLNSIFTKKSQSKSQLNVIYQVQQVKPKLN